MKIYTKTGDEGSSSLYGGKRLSKINPLFAAIGTVDELNAILGVIISDSKDSGLNERLLRLQHLLFVLGADLATPADVNAKLKIVRIDEQNVTQLEQEIDEIQLNLPELRKFILPGGSNAGAMLHLARSVCRRAEREIASAAEVHKINPAISHFINRLSDWLFVLARQTNQKDKVAESEWQS